MSLYTRAWIYTGWIVFTAISVVSITPHLGFFGKLAVALLWLSNGILPLFFFKCQSCGTSIFATRSTGSLFAEPTELAYQLDHPQ